MRTTLPWNDESPLPAGWRGGGFVWRERRVPVLSGAMTLGDVVRRWWAHRKLRRGQCEWCGTILWDDAEPVEGHRTCSEQCALDLWVSVTA